MAFLSFAEQALHYFDRPHESVRRDPVVGRAAWRGDQLAQRHDWIVELDGAAVAEVEQAVEAARRRQIALETLRREDFPLPTLRTHIATWARELARGRGFLLVRGLPVERWSEAQASLAYWGIGQHLGTPGAQNRHGDLLGHVTDMGEEASSPFVRRYRTAGDIAFHCDLADVVGLLCLRTPRSGGASRIASSVTIYNEIVARRPDLVDRLYEPFCLDTRDESAVGPTHVPVIPCRHSRGLLHTFYHSDYFRSAPRHADVAPLTAEEQLLLDLYEEIANAPGIYLDMQFAPGDMQLVSNHFVVHARTLYEDWPEPERKRHLLRLWLSLGSDAWETPA